MVWGNRLRRSVGPAVGWRARRRFFGWGTAARRSFAQDVTKTAVVALSRGGWHNSLRILPRTACRQHLMGCKRERVHNGYNGLMTWIRRCSRTEKIWEIHNRIHVNTIINLKGNYFWFLGRIERNFAEERDEPVQNGGMHINCGMQD